MSRLGFRSYGSPLGFFGGSRLGFFGGGAGRRLVVTTNAFDFRNHPADPGDSYWGTYWEFDPDTLDFIGNAFSSTPLEPYFRGSTPPDWEGFDVEQTRSASASAGYTGLVYTGEDVTQIDGLLRLTVGRAAEVSSPIPLPTFGTGKGWKRPIPAPDGGFWVIEDDTSPSMRKYGPTAVLQLDAGSVLDTYAPVAGITDPSSIVVTRTSLGGLCDHCGNVYAVMYTLEAGQSSDEFRVRFAKFDPTGVCVVVSDEISNGDTTHYVGDVRLWWKDNGSIAAFGISTQAEAPNDNYAELFELNPNTLGLTRSRYLNEARTDSGGQTFEPFAVDHAGDMYGQRVTYEPDSFTVASVRSGKFSTPETEISAVTQPNDFDGAFIAMAHDEATGGYFGVEATAANGLRVKRYDAAGVLQATSDPVFVNQGTDAGQGGPPPIIATSAAVRGDRQDRRAVQPGERPEECGLCSGLDEYRIPNFAVFRFYENYANSPYTGGEGQLLRVPDEDDRPTFEGVVVYTGSADPATVKVQLQADGTWTYLSNSHPTLDAFWAGAGRDADVSNRLGASWTPSADFASLVIEFFDPTQDAIADPCLDTTNGPPLYLRWSDHVATADSLPGALLAYDGETNGEHRWSGAGLLFARSGASCSVPIVIDLDATYRESDGRWDANLRAADAIGDASGYFADDPADFGTPCTGGPQTVYRLYRVEGTLP